MSDLNKIPSKDELTKLALNQEYQIGYREDLQRGTNCKGEMMNYLKNGKNIRLFVKKSFLRMNVLKFEEDYKLLKSKLKNIIPNQGFIGVGIDVFAFCAPIGIKVDIISDKNTNYIVELLKKEPKLLKQLKFFIKCYEEFLNEGRVLDLYGTENLVISDDNKLYYLDSFLVFHDSKNVQEGSLNSFDFLKTLINEVNK